MTDLDGAIRIEAAAPDSHFRLLPCPKCRSDNAAYVQYILGIQEPWKVRCFDCGHTVDMAKVFRHEAQAAWNNHAKEETDDRDHQKRAAESLQGMPGQVCGLF